MIEFSTFAVSHPPPKRYDDNPPDFILRRATEQEETGQRRNSVAELSEDDRQTVHEEWQI